jgi:hypothetical protein
LARLEEEATQRRINDERARLAAIVESQAQRERDAAAAELRAAELRKELADLPHSTPPAGVDTIPDIVVNDEPVEGELAQLVTDPPAMETIDIATRIPADPPPIETAVIATDTRDNEPETSDGDRASRGVVDVEDRRQPVRADSGRRALRDASVHELVGMLLLVVAFIWGARAQTYVDVDDTTAFTGGWGWDVAAVILTGALLAPLLVFFLGGQVPPWVAGTSIGFLTFQGFPLAVWFWRDWGDEEFPTHMIFIGMLLAAAWLAFRLGRRPVRATIDHRPSRWLQMGAAAAVIVTTYFYFDRIDWYHDYLPRASVLYLATGIVMLLLSTRPSVEPTLTLAVLAAACAVSFLAGAIESESWLRGRTWNVAAAAILLSVTAFWRAHRGAALTSAQTEASRST